MTKTAEPVRIAILDDRKELRESLRMGIQPALPRGWECVICPLDADMEFYPHWLQSQNISVLLLDQLLNEGQPDSELPVNYKGSDVMAAIRSVLPDFPIVIVTAAPDDGALQASLGNADSIVEREVLLEDIEKYVPRFQRMASSFTKRNEAELDRLGQLSEKSAMGNATPAELSELKAIQQAISFSIPARSAEAEEALQQLEQQMRELQDFEARLLKKMQSQQ